MGRDLFFAERIASIAEIQLPVSGPLVYVVDEAGVSPVKKREAQMKSPCKLSAVTSELSQLLTHSRPSIPFVSEASITDVGAIAFYQCPARRGLADQI